MKPIAADFLPLLIVLRSTPGLFPLHFLIMLAFFPLPLLMALAVFPVCGSIHFPLMLPVAPVCLSIVLVPITGKCTC